MIYGYVFAEIYFHFSLNEERGDGLTFTLLNETESE